MFPAVTGSGLSDLVSDKFAEVFTVVAALAKLFAELGSLVVDETPAVFVIIPVVLGFTVTVAVMVALAPALRVPSAQGNVAHPP